MKKWIFRIVGAVIALVVLALVLVFINLNSIVKKSVETVGPQLTKVDVRLGSAKLSPMNGNGELSKLFVGNPEGYKSPSSIEAGNVRVEVKLSTVLKDTIQIDEVNIQAPVITFEGGLTGNNLMTILKNLEGAPDDVKPTPKGKPASEGGKKFFVKDVVINGGQIHVLITGLGAKSLTVPLPPIHLQNIGSENNGVTAAQLCKEILKPLIGSATKAGLDAIAGIGSNVKELGKGATEQLNKTTSGLKGFFKK